MKKLIIFGIGKIADEAFYYFKNDSSYEIAAFTVDQEYLSQEKNYNLPVVPFEKVEEFYPPQNYDMFIATGYQELNKLRSSRYELAKQKGYCLASFISSRASNFGNVEIGDNCFILENVVIQPCSKIGNDVFLWSGNHVGHHASVGDHCYIAGQVIISGTSVIEPYCFIGVHATIGHEIVVGMSSFIGAGSLITKNVEQNSVYIAQDTQKFRLDSSSFLKLTKMK